MKMRDSLTKRKKNKGFTPSLEDGVVRRGFSPIRHNVRKLIHNMFVRRFQEAHKKTTPSFSAGFTLLMATLVSAILLSIGLAIVSITLKQIVLISTSRNSEIAYFAADSGLECALYWDLKDNAFATSTTSSIDCNGQTVENTGGPSGVTTFTITYTPYAHCATVTVTKSIAGTEIEARGYNTCDSSDPRRVERGIRTSYDVI